MKKFSQIIQETSETIERLKKNEQAKKAARSHGLERVGKDTMDGKSRYRYSDRGVDKGKTSYYSHMQYKRGHQDQKHSDIQTTVTKVKEVPNGIERSTIDRKKHANVDDAAKHISTLRNYHKNKSD